MSTEVIDVSDQIELLKQSSLERTSTAPELSALVSSESIQTESLNVLSTTMVEASSAPVTLIVSTHEELLDAMDALEGTGGEILMLPGNYGYVEIKNYFPNAEVTLRSFDESNPALIEKMKLQNSADLQFDSLEIGRGLLDGEADFMRIVKAIDVSNVTFSNNEIHGSDDGDYTNDGYGLSFKNSQDITLVNNEIHNLHRGAIFGGTQNIVVTDNYIHDIRSDGLDFAGVEHVLIEGNYLTDFYPNSELGDHGDFIQFWTTGAGNSSDVTIRNNALIEGDGGTVQGIFIENDIDGNYYENFTIDGNLYYGSSPNGLVVDDLYGGSIINNTILGRPDGTRTVRVSVFGESTDVQLEGNVSTAFIGEVGDLVANGNIIAHYDDLDSPTHVENLFVNALSDEHAVVSDFIPRSDGLLATGGTGALVDSVAEIVILSDQSSGNSDSLTVGFEAQTFGEDDQAVTYKWIFQDGTTAEGASVEVEFAEGGEQAVLLQKIGADGTVLAETTKILDLVTPNLLDLTFDKQTDAQNRDYTWVGAESYVETGSGKAATFSAANPSKIIVAGDPTLRGMAELTVSMDIMLGNSVYDSSSDAQRVLWYHGAYGIEINDESNVTFYLWLEDGGVETVKVETSALNDGAWHELSMTYDASTGVFTAGIDGVATESLTGLSGEVANDSTSDLVIGSGPFRAAFDGAIDNVSVSQTLQDGAAKTAVFSDTFDGEDGGVMRFETEDEYIYYTDEALQGTTADDDVLSVFFDVRTDGAITDKQRLLWNHMEYGVSIENGDVVFWTFDNDNKSTRMYIKDAGVDDGDWHQLGFFIDEKNNVFRAYIDGEVVAENLESNAALSGNDVWDVTLGGTPWGKDFFGDIDNLTAYDSEVDPNQQFDQTTMLLSNSSADELFA